MVRKGILAKSLILLLLLFLIAGCERASKPEPDALLDASIQQILSYNNIKTAAVGVVEDGELVWAGHYGEQAPGVPASKDTQFDIGSITKVVAAETVLRLADQGLLSLDEPMGAYWIDPDLSSDPQVMQLTPRMVLTHTSGFLNWRNHDDEGILRFVNDPGTVFGYSGEGFDYLMRFVENKLGTPFPELVQSKVFDPAGVRNAAFAFRENNLDNVARSVDEATGEFDERWRYHCKIHLETCREDGAYSAASDMAISVEEFAAILIAVMKGEGYPDAMVTDRNRVQSEKDRALVYCDTPGTGDCPRSQGYGLGWEVLDYGDEVVLGHGGHDPSVLTQTYFYQQRQDGYIVFLSAPELSSLRAMPDILEALDPGSPMADQYRGWLRYELWRMNEAEDSDSD